MCSMWMWVMWALRSRYGLVSRNIFIGKICRLLEFCSVWFFTCKHVWHVSLVVSRCPCSIASGLWYKFHCDVRDFNASSVRCSLLAFLLLSQKVLKWFCCCLCSLFHLIEWVTCAIAWVHYNNDGNNDDGRTTAVHWIDNAHYTSQKVWWV